ncbi:MAG: hypothetical protein LBL62_01075, partial [Planctomycetaceae bacterium]|nr:hypothetical protein [Planctomycetaceae bacterium]
LFLSNVESNQFQSHQQKIQLHKTTPIHYNPLNTNYRNSMCIANIARIIIWTSIKTAHLLNNYSIAKKTHSQPNFSDETTSSKKESKLLERNIILKPF